MERVTLHGGPADGREMTVRDTAEIVIAEQRPPLRDPASAHKLLPIIDHVYARRGGQYKFLGSRRLSE